MRRAFSESNSKSQNACLWKIWLNAGKMKSKVERIFVEKKYFQVEFEGLNGGTWVSNLLQKETFISCRPEGVKGKGWEDLRKAILSVQENPERDGGASKEKNDDIRMNRDTFRGGRSYAEVVAEAGLRTGGSLSAGKWARAVICESQEKVQDWTHEGRAIARMMGMKGMVSINPISAFKGCFFVSSTRRAERVHDQGRLSVKGRTILLRKWSPKENMVVQGKFRRGWLVLKGLPFHLWDEVQLNFILKKWGRVTKVAKETLKLVDLTRAKLWVEMLPNVVLPALLEVEDGEWSYTVAVSVTGEDEDADAVTSEFKRSRNKWDIECYRKRRLPRARYRQSRSCLAVKGEIGGGWSKSGQAEAIFIGPVHESPFKAHKARAQSGMRHLGLQRWPRCSSSPPVCIGFVPFSPASCFIYRGDRDALSRRCKGRRRGFLLEKKGWAVELKAQSCSTLGHRQTTPWAVSLKARRGWAKA
ncbi:hypothetical protein CK203_008449 [Vitis vinifera]|uniref:Uncharacterized protein n=1 Tax=Vitis vinifera TaxID=29760 RepID=A0A438KPB2_VITVI|nr:hypothetical protein CK203_008449 [Vitis vinifera]